MDIPEWERVRQRTVVHVAEVMLQQGVPVVQALQYRVPRVELGQAVAKVIRHRPRPAVRAAPLAFHQSVSS